jgi:hypothetical protein
VPLVTYFCRRFLALLIDSGNAEKIDHRELFSHGAPSDGTNSVDWFSTDLVWARSKHCICSGGIAGVGALQQRSERG